MAQLEDNTQRKIKLEDITKINNLLMHRKGILKKLNEASRYEKEGKAVKLTVNFCNYSFPVDKEHSATEGSIYATVWRHLVDKIYHIDNQLEELNVETKPLPKF